MSEPIINSVSPFMTEMEKYRNDQSQYNLVHFNKRKQSYLMDMIRLINNNSSLNLQLLSVINYFNICTKLNAAQAMYLIDSGANINIQRKYFLPYSTILIEACKYFMLELVNNLIDHNVDLNLTDFRKRTALIYTCRSVNSQNGFKCIESLINAGADPDIQDSDGMTALMYAINNKCVRYAHPTIITLLKSSNILISDKKGYTVYDHYVKNSHKKIKLSDHDILVLKGDASYINVKSARCI